MNLNDLSLELTKRTGLLRRESDIAIKETFGIIADALKNGDKVMIMGFGTFETEDRAPRAGRNIRLSKPVMIPARKVPVFRASKVLKRNIEKSV